MQHIGFFVEQLTIQSSVAILKYIYILHYIIKEAAIRYKSFYYIQEI